MTKKGQTIMRKEKTRRDVVEQMRRILTGLTKPENDDAAYERRFDMVLGLYSGALWPDGGKTNLGHELLVDMVDALRGSALTFKEERTKARALEFWLRNEKIHHYGAKEELAELKAEMERDSIRNQLDKIDELEEEARDWRKLREKLEGEAGEEAKEWGKE